MRRALRAALAACLVVAALGVAPPADAQFTTDAALIEQMIVEETQAVAQLTQILQTLKNQTQLLNQVLTGEPFQDLGLAIGLLPATYQNYQAIIADLKSIGYSMQSVDFNFNGTFPNAAMYQGMQQTGYPAVESGWSDEILASAHIADRSQASISDTAQLTNLATQLISESGSAPGEVAELQLIVEMLGVVQAGVTQLVQNLTTTGRALVDTAAAAASERQLSADRRRRNRLNYTSRGAPVGVPNQLP